MCADYLLTLVCIFLVLLFVLFCVYSKRASYCNFVSTSDWVASNTWQLNPAFSFDCFYYRFRNKKLDQMFTWLNKYNWNRTKKKKSRSTMKTIFLIIYIWYQIKIKSIINILKNNQYNTKQKIDLLNFRPGYKIN